MESRLGSLFQIWIDDRNALMKENRPSFQNKSSMKTGRSKLDSMYDHLGFTVELGRSKVAGGGTGVVIGKGTVQAQQVVAMYPGKCMALQALEKHSISSIYGYAYHLITGSDCSS